MSSNSSTAQIFISYASQDREKIKPLVEVLEAAGWSVWWDRQIVAGDRFDHAIEEAIDHAACVIVAWTESALESDWVRAEAMEGMERKCLVPIALEAVRIPLGFRALNTVNLIGWPRHHDDDEMQRLLEKVDALLEERQEPDVLPEPARPTTESIEEEHRPSIAVLPFVSSATSEGEEALVAGVTNEVISSLSHVPNFFIISFATIWNYRDRLVNVRQIGMELGVSYVVHGTLISTGDKFNVIVELVQAATGRQLWSESFNVKHTLDDILHAQNAIARGIAGRLQPKLIVTEQLRSRNAPIEDLEVWQLVNRARPLYLNEQNSKEGTELLRRALEIDPSCVEAHAILATYLSFMPETRRPEIAAEAQSQVEKALELNPIDDRALLAAGLTYVQLAQWDKALSYCQRAVEANPNLAAGWVNYAIAVIGVRKDARTALEYIDRAFELSPQDDSAYVWHHFRAAALAELEQYSDAAESSASSVNHYGGFWFTWLCHCQYLAASRQIDEARGAWQQAASLYPDLSFELYEQTVMVSPLSPHVNAFLMASVRDMLSDEEHG